jgi:hypothetical protein
MLRQTLRAMGIGFWSLLSLDLLIGLFDYYTRLDFIKGFLANHPRVAEAVHSPLVYLALLVLGFAFIQAERKLKLPHIRARYTNFKVVPNITKIPMKAVFDTEMKKPGWDTQELDWFLFVELQLANETPTPVTVDEVKAKFLATPASWIEKLLPFKRKPIKVNHVTDFSGYELHLEGGGYGKGAEVPNLLKNINGSPLTQGVGHRGWLCFSAKANQQDLTKPLLDIWLIDAFGGKHRLDYEKDESKWDKQAEIHCRIR